LNGKFHNRHNPPVAAAEQCCRIAAVDVENHPNEFCGGRIFTRPGSKVNFRAAQRMSEAGGSGHRCG
jgi:hypothetical protein